MNESLLISQIEPLRSKAKRGEVIGIVSASRWQGGQTITIAQENWRVAQCDSVLELRERLSEDTLSPLIVITPPTIAEIGDDVRARLYKQRFFPVDPWMLLMARFKARLVDPALRLQPELAEATLEALEHTVPNPAPTGVLTPEAVWQIVITRTLCMSSARPDVQELLEWVTTDAATARWHCLDEALRRSLRAWLVLNLGEMAALLIHVLESGSGSEALAVGLAIGALRQTPSDAQSRVVLGTSQGRLERYTGNRPIDPSLLGQWNEASEQWAAHASTSGGANAVREKLAQADKILESIGGSEFAAASKWSPLGFQRRLVDFVTGLNGNDATQVRRAFSAISCHEGARHLEELRGQRDRAEMATRLFRWLNRTVEPAADFDIAVSRYISDASWVDWARHKLLTGDEPEAVSRGYRHLFDLVTNKRELENRNFARLLATSTAIDQYGTNTIPVEDVLARVVAPLARRISTGILVVVMDGMSWPVLHELNQDLASHGWREWAPLGDPSFGCALAVLPSVTLFSRSSLLSGSLASGGQSVEKRNFEEHPDLRAASKASFPPILFHKDEIGASGGDLGESVRMEIRNPNRKVVGTVVNVVDDSLEGPEQLAIRWGLEQVPVLRALLSEARDAGRVVVLLSDHGHVLDERAKLTRRPGASDRWRPVVADAPPSDDEILVTGRRVLAENRQFVSPTIESLRYSPNRRQGYHGGLTPQECLAPISVIGSSLAEIEGWQIQTAVYPDWWLDEGGRDEPAVSSYITTRKRKVGPRPALPLFQDRPATVDLVAGVLGSDIFVEQMEVFGGRIRSEQIEEVLRALLERNGVQMKASLAQRLTVPPIRIDGLLASIQRILNVDGYPVLTTDSSQTVRLNSTLLKEQFALDEGDQK